MKTGWDLARGLTYLAMLVASALAAFGAADFDPSTGYLDVYPVNVYAIAGSIAGIISSSLAFIALARGWGRKPKEPDEL